MAALRETAAELWAEMRRQRLRAILSLSGAALILILSLRTKRA